MRHFSLSVTVLALLGLTSGFGSVSTRILPAPGETIQFARTYSSDELKNHPLRFVKKTNFVLKNTRGLLTGVWTATIRDIRNDESLNLSATGICKGRRKDKMECTFDASAGTINLSARQDGVYISIPQGQGVRFSGEKDGAERTEMLLGTDEDNREFILESKKSS